MWSTLETRSGAPGEKPPGICTPGTLVSSYQSPAAAPRRGSPAWVGKNGRSRLHKCELRGPSTAGNFAEISRELDDCVRCAARRDDGGIWWALKDLNLRPTDYESAALTAELRALVHAIRALFIVVHVAWRRLRGRSGAGRAPGFGKRLTAQLSYRQGERQWAKDAFRGHNRLCIGDILPVRPEQ